MKTQSFNFSRAGVVFLYLLLSCFLLQASNYYWVGGSGLWSDAANHWATSSGGSVHHPFAPDSTSNVIFDSNSFQLPGSTVTVDMQHISTRDLDFSAVTNHPRIVTDTSNVSGGDLNVNGSFILSAILDWQYGSYFNPSVIRIGSTGSGHIIDFAGLPCFGRTMLIIGDAPSQTGLYFLLSDISCWRLEVDNGSLNTNGKNIFASDSFTLNNGQADLTGSNISTGNFTAFQFANVLPGTATIHADAFSVSTSQSPYHDVFTNRADLHNAHVSQLHATNSLDGSNSNIDVAFLGMDTVMNFDVHASGMHFGKCVSRAGNFHFSNGGPPSSTVFNFDTLFLATRGGNYNFSDSDSIIITHQLIVNSGPGNITSIQTMPGFHNARLYCYSDTVCLDYLFLSNLSALGSAVYYAGQNSIDGGGNTGWNFSSCSRQTPVWPGDADYDLQCNNLDVLSIGLAYGATGPVRTGGSLSWSPQPVPDWPGFFNSGVNFKHADTDGNGVVDAGDTVAVYLNYGQTHPARIRPETNTPDQTNPQIRLTPSSRFLRPGQHVTITIQAGTPSLPVDSIYGVAFTVNLDPNLVYLDSITTDFSSSWMGNISSNLIPFTKVSPFGQFDITLVRNNQADVLGGNGIIGLFDVVIVDNVSTVQSQLLRATGVHAITSDGTSIGINAATDSMLIDPSLGVGSIVTEDQVLLYPNPASGQLYIHASGGVDQVVVSNVLGEILLEQHGTSPRMIMNVNGLSPDVYIIQVYTGKSVYRRKVVIRN